MQSDITASIIGAIPWPAVLISAQGRIEAMNPRAVDLLGPQGLGRNYLTALRQPALLDCIDSVLRDGRQTTTRYVVNSLVRETSYKVAAAPVALGPDKGAGALLTFEDLSEVELADVMRRDFVANVSHELKTPLTALLGFIETLRGAARDDVTARERFLSIMEREAERMNRLVSDLLSLSRVESSERQRPRDAVNLTELIRSTEAALRPMAAASEVTLDVQLPQSGATEPVVAGDADQLQQVLTNLMENAIKYGGRGGTVTIRLSCHAREISLRGPAVQIDVVDTGDGFDPVHIPRLTERFYRVDTHRSREMGGTGLGLSIAKHIVNRHRGRLRIETEPGVGSCFSVLLPMLEMSAANTTSR